MRPPRFSIQWRVTGAVLLTLLAAFILAGQQALQIARQDASTAMRVQASAQLAALSQVVAESAIARDYRTMQMQLKTPIAQGNLQYVEYTLPTGQTVREQAPFHQAERPDWFASLADLDIPVFRQELVVDDQFHGHLLVQPSSHAYEDFLWHLGSRLFWVLAIAFILLGWLIHALLRFSLRDLGRLRATARQIEAGDYRTRLPMRAGSPPELQETTRAFNHMSAALERLLTDLNEQQKALDNTACVTESDLAGNITFANELFCVASGYTREELLGQSHRIVNSGLHDAKFFAQMWATISNGRTWRGEVCNRAKDGRPFWLETTIIPIKGDDGQPLKYLSIRFDTTRRKLDEAALNEEKARWQVTLQSINDAVIVTNANNQITYLNPSAESLLGVAIEDTLLKPLKGLMQFDLGESDNEAPACWLQPAVELRGQTGSAQLRTQFGQSLAISYSCAPLAGDSSFGAIYVLRDETEKKQLLDDLRDMAFHDPLTTLPNRRAVEGRLARALCTAHDLTQQHAFCYIDLDQFKLVNDTCGHSVGDALLLDVAHAMQETLPSQAYLGRLGGDEFGLILFNTQPDEAGQICRQLVQRIRAIRFQHKGRRFTLGACAGIAPIAQTDTTAEDIMIQADMACYRAKSEGSGRVVLYQADDAGFRRLEAEMGWAMDFALAMEANQFLPYRQLIQPTSTSGQSHYEVLIRWRRNGVIEGPAKLLPALERYGQAPVLDRWMVEAVISYLAAQPDDPSVYFINLSGKTVADELFLEDVCLLLDRYGVSGSRLGFEVTETAAVVNLSDARRLIFGLRGRGCQFALDDFGRDASSFYYLKHLPANFLKIDGEFVRGMLDDRRDQAIVRSIAQLARDFKMRSVAEQVEDADMAGLLNDIGVDYLQGYHIHRPEPFPGWQPFAGAQPVQSAPLAESSHLKLVT